jgi:TRAP-type transport system periplasmic protein
MQSESKLAWSLVSLALLVSVPAPATELRALASWDDTHPARRILLQAYLKSVETASKGDLIFKLSGPETVPPFEQLQPAGAGGFQLLFTHPGYHIGITPYLIPIDGLKGDSKTLRESGVYELIDRHYQRFGLKLIFVTKSAENSGYQVILREPVGPSGDLTGRKIRGTQNYGGVLSCCTPRRSCCRRPRSIRRWRKAWSMVPPGRLSASWTTSGTKWPST